MYKNATGPLNAHFNLSIAKSVVVRLEPQHHASISQGQICSDSLRITTPRQKWQVRLAVSPIHSILTPGQPVPALTLYRQVPGRAATGVPIFKPVV